MSGVELRTVDQVGPERKQRKPICVRYRISNFKDERLKGLEGEGQFPGTAVGNHGYPLLS